MSMNKKEQYELTIIDGQSRKTLFYQNLKGSWNLNSIESETEISDSMVFNIYADITVYGNSNINKPVRFIADGFDELVKLLDINDNMIKIETTYEVGKKLKEGDFRT